MARTTSKRKAKEFNPQLIGVFFLVFSLLGAVVFYVGFRSNVKYRDAVTTSAVVLESRSDIVTVRDSEGNRRRERRYSSKVRFSDATGTSHEFWTDDDPDEDAVGSTITIQYLPDDPSQARRVDFMNQHLLEIVGAALGLGFLVIGGAIVIAFRGGRGS